MPSPYSFVFWSVRPPSRKQQTPSLLHFMSYKSVNPATGEVLQVYPEHTDQQMLDALAKADRTYRESWRSTPYRERAQYLGRAASMMLKRKESLARLATVEMGKRIEESRWEVDLSASIIQYYADNAEKFLAPRQLNSIMGDAHIENSPIGVLIGIQPWNYPYYQLARFAGPNLMSGNVILLKHAPGVPQCALAFEQVLTEAGLPSGVYTNLFLSNDQVSTLIDDPRTRGLALTGSERAGEALASRAGKNLKKNTMELGGSDAFIVLPDADLAHTVKMAIVGRFGNNGQTCIGAKRFIVVESVKEKFLSAFTQAAKALKLGDPLDESVTLGPLSSEAALQLLLKQVQEATTNGARVLLGGERAGNKGSFIQPTILTDIAPDNPAFRQEFFGPVALIFVVKDEDEAVTLANNSPYGLGGSIYTTDIEHGKRVASRIETGMVFINYPSISAPDLPFGGIKRSGYGKELSDLGIQEFINRKLVCAANKPSLVG
jgi:succinate-semialdehyde dehydrogenase / glutarate-semialdehyde dehydrogenase